MIPVWIAALLFGAPASPLERCRTLDPTFDAKAMISVCSRAGDDDAYAPKDRADALRLLAFAQSALGNDKAAEATFVRYLVLIPDAVLEDDASPRFRSTFARAQQRVATEGAVRVTLASSATSPLGAAIPVSVTLVDPMRRVVRVSVRTSVERVGEPPEIRETPLTRLDEKYVGEVAPMERADRDATMTIDVVLVSAAERVVLPAEESPRVTLVHRAPEPVHIAPEEPEARDLPWGWIGVGASLVTAAVVGGGLGWCYLAGPCRAPPEEVVRPPQDATLRVVVGGAP